MEEFWRTLKYKDIYPISHFIIKEARYGIEAYVAFTIKKISCNSML
jgi:hypothetical protein